MEERFDSSPIRVSRDAEDPGDGGGDGGGGAAALPKPPPVRPPVEVFLKIGDEQLAQVRLDGDETADQLEALLAEHPRADKVRITTPATGLTREQVAPFKRLARRHQVDFEIELGAGDE